MGKQYHAKSKRFKRLFVLHKVSRLAHGIRACYRYDSRVQRVINGLPEGFDICVGILGHSHTVVITKIGDELHCKMTDGYAAGGIYIYFKNMEGAIQVLRNRISYLQAYTQSYIVIEGGTERAIDFVNMLLIVQNYMATARQRRRYLGELSEFEVPVGKIRRYAYFRGWIA